MRAGGRTRWVWLAVAGLTIGGLLAAGAAAPEFLPTPDRAARYLGPSEAPPLGNDARGVPLIYYAEQGAQVVTAPAMAAGALVMALATMAGLTRCAGLSSVDTFIQGASELVGALPRMVVLLVLAMLLPPDVKGLLPIALAWAVLAAPGAMDEAAASAERIGGARFVEALRAHGFSAARIYGYHVAWLNLRPVIVRQGAEVAMQVVFLEIALSYLAVSTSEPSFTHPENLHSWATLLYQGYTALLGEPLYHSLVTGLVLVGMVALGTQSLRLAARGR